MLNWTIRCIQLITVFVQAWSAAKQGDIEKTKYLWKRRKIIWNMIAVIWLVIGGVPLAIIIPVALLYCVEFKYSN